MAKKTKTEQATDVVQGGLEKEKKSAINFRLPDKLKGDLELLAASANSDVSAILVDVVTELVNANRQRIESFRKSSARPINLPTFATSPPPRKASLKKKKNPAAQVDGKSTTEGGDGNETS